MAWNYTSDLSDGFFKYLNDVICVPWNIRTMDMLGVMMSESGVHAYAKNPTSSARGLIQMMDGVWQRCGFHGDGDAFLSISAEQQLPYVKNYFAPYAKKNLDSPGRVYQAVFLPGTLDGGSAPETVIAAKGGPLGWAYAANSVFDENHDFSITVGELSDAVRRNCRGTRWTEIVMRLHGVDGTVTSKPVTPTYDLRTIRGLQEALTKLGFDCGTVDGIAGPKTHMAVVHFQQAHPECGPVDGMPGPKTRSAITSLLTAVPAP